MNTRIDQIKNGVLILVLFLMCFQTSLLAQYTSNDYFERGKQLHQEENFSQAIEYYSLAIGAEGNCEKCLYNRGLALIKLEKYNKALVDFNKVLIMNPADVDAYEQRGGLHYLLGNAKEAISDYNYVIKVNPNAEMHINRGMAYLELGQYYEALRDLEIAAVMDKYDPEAYRVMGDVYFAKSDLEQALEYYDKALAIDPTDERTLNNRGNIYNQTGQEDLAIRDYDQALDNYQNSHTLTNRANYWLKQGDYEKALADCREASRLDYNNAEAYYCTGLVENARGNTAMALENFNKAIAINDNQALYYNGRGLALFTMAQYEDALEDFEQAVSIDPSDAAAKDRIMDCHRKLETRTVAMQHHNIPNEEFTARGVSEYDFSSNINTNKKKDDFSASRDIDQILKRDVKTTNLVSMESLTISTPTKMKEVSEGQKAKKYLELADFYFASRDYIEALQHYESALWHNKFAEDAYLKKAHCLIALQQNEDALKALDQHLIFHSDDPEAYYHRATLRLRTGNIFGAKEDYDEGLRIDDSHQQLLLSRAQWNADNDFFLKAIEDYSTLISIHPQADIYHQRGMMWFALKNFRKAIEDHTQAILNSDVDKSDFYFARGQAYQFNKAMDLAIYDYDKAIELSPRFAKAYMYRAAAKSSQGDQEGTCIDYQMAINLGFKVTGNIDFISACK